MKKGLLALTLVFSMLSGNCVPVPAQEETAELISAEKSQIAEIVFDKTPGTMNINRYFFSEKDITKRVTVGGKEAIRMDASEGCLYLMLDLDDNAFPKSEKEQSAAVTVEYFDEGYGHFTLRYDSVKNSVSNICEDHVDVVRLKDSRQWKTHTFYIDDAAFGGTLQGSDVIVGLWSTRTGSISSDDITLRSVRVERAFPQKPVIINLNSGEYGNVFKAEDTKDMYFHFDNITDTNIDFNLEYSIVDEELNVYDTGAFDMKVVPEQEEQVYHIKTDVTKYGLYNVLLTGEMKYVFEGETYTKEINSSFNFSVANKFGPDEEKNPYYGVCTHMGQTEKRTAEKTGKMVADAGLGMIRDEPYWRNIELQKGVYDFSSPLTSFPKEMGKKDVDVLLLAHGGNVLYESCENNAGGIPTAKEDMEAYAKNILKTIEASDGAVKYVEIWNEPDVYSVFNPLNRTPEEYTELLKVAYPIIKKAYPDVVVMGCAEAGTSWNWTKRIFEAGGYDYMDAVSVHAYDWSGSLRYDHYHNIMTDLKETMSKYGEIKPIWITEVGWATSTCSVEEQARYLVRLYAFLKANDYCEAITTYEFQNSGTDSLDQEHNFGMINYYGNSSNVMNTLFSGGAGKDVKFEDVSTPWSAKRSYLTVTAMNKLIGNAECVETVNLGDGVHAYRFARKDGKSAVIFWSEYENKNISVKLDCSKAEIYDLYSNSKTVENADGIFNITAQKDQSYILGDFSTISLAETVVETGPVDIKWAKDDKVSFNFDDKLKRDLRIEIEAADVFEVIENNSVTDGKGSLVVYGNPVNGLMDYKINVNLYDGDTLCHTETKIVKFIEPVSISIDKAEIAGSLNRMRLNIQVKNNSSAPHSGKVRIIAPERIKAAANIPGFSNLRPGSSMILPVNLPRELKKRLENVTVEVELSDGKIITETKKVSYGEIKYTNRKPVIDGVTSYSEWNGTWILVDRAEDIGSTGFKGWSGPEDCSFSCNFMWDEEYLYMLFVAEDDIFSQNYTGYNMWQGDSIQVGLRRADSVYDASFNELGFALTSAGSEVYRYSSYSGQSTGSVQDFKGSYAKKGNSVVYEVAIPWKEALSADYVPEAGNKIAFSALFNDNDGNGRRGWLQYTDGIGSTKSASLFDVISLTK